MLIGLKTIRFNLKLSRPLKKDIRLLVYLSRRFLFASHLRKVKIRFLKSQIKISTNYVTYVYLGTSLLFLQLFERLGGMEMGRKLLNERFPVFTRI